MENNVYSMLTLAAGAGALFLYFRKMFLKNQGTQLKTEDKVLVEKQRAVESELIDIKKQLAEKSTGLTNMTPEQVEDFWKKN